jgi:hypothetical protein
MTEECVADRGLGRFQIVSRQAGGGHYWQLINPNGTPTARSMYTYASEEAAVAAAEEARRLIGEAPIVRS